MNRMLVGIFIGLATVATCQDRTVAPPPSFSVAAPRFEKGIVEGRTYKNASVGLELTPAPWLNFGNPDLKAKAGAPGAFVTIVAWGDQKWRSPRDGTIFWADALANYPEDRRSTEARMESVVQDNHKAGFELLESSKAAKLGAVAFARADFKKGAVHEGIFVKACDTQALVLIFFGEDKEAVDKLVAGTELKLDLTTSGCGPKAVGIHKK